MIKLRETETMGWGVFAKTYIPINTLIERNDIISFTPQEWPIIKQTRFGPLVFVDRDEEPTGGYFAMGNITRINHDDEPNAAVRKGRHKGQPVVVLTALRNIEKGEQLFIRYKNRGDPKLYPWYRCRKSTTVGIGPV